MKYGLIENPVCNPVNGGCDYQACTSFHFSLCNWRALRVNSNLLEFLSFNALEIQWNSLNQRELLKTAIWNNSLCQRHSCFCALSDLRSECTVARTSTAGAANGGGVCCLTFSRSRSQIMKKNMQPENGTGSPQQSQPGLGPRWFFSKTSALTLIYFDQALVTVD